MVYLRYYTSVERGFSIIKDGRIKDYLSIVRNNISLMEVDDDDVALFLSKKCGCCTNEKPCFRIATEEEITRWKQ